MLFVLGIFRLLCVPEKISSILLLTLEKMSHATHKNTIQNQYKL